MNCKVSLNVAQQPEGGFTVTCNELPELVTEGDSVDEAMVNFKDAYAATVELYEDLGRPTPDKVQPASDETPTEGRRRFSRIRPESRVRSGEDVPVDNGLLRFEAMLSGFGMELSPRKLITLGCHEKPRRGGGSHQIWSNPLTGGWAVLPDYGDRDLRIGTVRAVTRNLGVGWEEFLRA